MTRRPSSLVLCPFKKEGTMKASIGLTDTQSSAVTKILATLLADESLLYTKTRNYHWNVVGPQFNDLHKFFEAQYEALDGVVDDVAERIRTLGHQTPATMAEFLKSAQLKEHPGRFPSAASMLSNLLSD